MAFKSWDKPARTNTSHRLEKNDISIVARDSGTSQLMFNSEISAFLMVNNLFYLDIQQDEITGEIALVCNSRSNGMPMSTRQYDKGSKTRYVSFANKEWVGKLVKELKLERNKLHHVRISDDMSRIHGFASFKILTEPKATPGSKDLFE